MALILAGFKDFLVPMVAWGIKIVCNKFEEMFTKIDNFFFTENGKTIFYHIFAQLHAHLHFIFFAIQMCKSCKLEATLPNQVKRKVLNLNLFDSFIHFLRINLSEQLIRLKLGGARGHFP